MGLLVCINTPGNWPGKTVSNAAGFCNFGCKNFLLVDIPGTYSIMSNSTEEEIARDYICFGNADATVIIIDATSLERNLNLVYQILEITNNVVVCVNLLDEASKKGINIDLELLSKTLGVPVVGTVAKKKKTLKNLISTISRLCAGDIKPTPKPIKYERNIEDLVLHIQPIVEKIIPKKYLYLSRWVSLKLLDGDEKIISSIEHFLSIDFKDAKLENAISEAKALMGDNLLFRESVISNIIKASEKVSKSVCSFDTENYNNRDKKIDKILTSKIFGFPIMILFLGLIFWITISGANYPSQILANIFAYVQERLLQWFNIIHTPSWLTSILINGIFQTVSWVVSVMLPPMAIFFPLFTLLEDLGYLPRIAFNLDKYFKKACTSRKASSHNVYGIWM